MSKTVDDLIGVYIEASNAVVWEAERRGLCPMTLDMQRAGVAAVVRDLRDEIRRPQYSSWEDIENFLDEILGDAGENDGVAQRIEHGVSTSDVAGSSPAAVATAPAPAVCEWTTTAIDPMGYAWMNSGCGLVDCHERDVLMQPNPQKHCPSCGKRIEFVEVQR